VFARCLLGGCYGYLVFAIALVTGFLLRRCSPVDVLHHMRRTPCAFSPPEEPSHERQRKGQSSSRGTAQGVLLCWGRCEVVPLLCCCTTYGMAKAAVRTAQGGLLRVGVCYGIASLYCSCSAPDGTHVPSACQTSQKFNRNPRPKQQWRHC
jgi:hypothetical protein